MRLLDADGTPEQRARWLDPLLDGAIRSAICITEPGRSGADPNEMTTRIELRGRDLVVAGEKHWCTGAASPHCKVLFVVGVCAHTAPRQARHAIALVPTDTPGVHIDSTHSVFGYADGFRGGRVSIRFEDAVVPRSCLLGEPGEGLTLMQALLGPAAFTTACASSASANARSSCSAVVRQHAYAFGEMLADHGVVQDWIAESRIRIEHLRALVTHTATLVDHRDDRQAASANAVLKASGPTSIEWIVDKAIQAHGADGFSHQSPLAMLWTYARTLRISDGPDEVHRRTGSRATN